MLHRPCLDGELTRADDHAERRAALDMIHRHYPSSTRRLTLGADKGYDAAEFIRDLRRAYVAPHRTIKPWDRTPRSSTLLGWLGRRKIGPGSRLGRMLARKPKMLVAIALANKMARQIWAMLTRNDDFKNPASAIMI